MIKLTREDGQTIYIVAEQITHIEPDRAGTKINLITSIMTVKESIEEVVLQFVRHKSVCVSSNSNEVFDDGKKGWRYSTSILRELAGIEE